MQRIDFFRLDRPIQERFIASSRGEASPRPLGVLLEPLPRPVLIWGGASVGALALLGALAAHGFGELTNPVALNPTWMLAFYVTLGLIIGFSGRRAMAEIRARRSMPYVPGVFLFPSGLIDARSSEFVVRPLRELDKVEISNRALTVHYSGGSVRLPMPNREHAEMVSRALDEFRTRANEDAPHSVRDIALLDPLADNGFKSPFSPPESMRPPARKRVQLDLLFALGGGAIGGLLVFVVRGYLADDAIYNAARIADTREAYVTYLERGGARPEVTEILLPRTELAAIVASKNLEALERFAAAHENSKVSEESDIALQHALRRALDEVRAKGQLAALKQFAEKHGKHPKIAPEVERALEQHWQAALKTFEQSARPRGDSKAFFQRLFAYTAKHGSRVELRFRRRLDDSIERTEKALRKNRRFAGESSLPGRYFDDKHAEKREEPVAQELLAAFRRVFPQELVEFHLAPPLPVSAEEVPPVQVPTVLITHRTETRGNYVLKKPRAAVTGVGVHFRVTFQIPGDPEVDVFRTGTFSSPESPKTLVFEGYDDLYEGMAERAFSKLPKRYLADLLPGLSAGEG